MKKELSDSINKIIDEDNPSLNPQLDELELAVDAVNLKQHSNIWDLGILKADLKGFAEKLKEEENIIDSKKIYKRNGIRKP